MPCPAHAIKTRDFWPDGAVFGVIFLAISLLIGLPLLR